MQNIFAEFWAKDAASAGQQSFTGAGIQGRI